MAKGKLLDYLNRIYLEEKAFKRPPIPKRSKIPEYRELNDAYSNYDKLSRSGKDEMIPKAIERIDVANGEALRNYADLNRVNVQDYVSRHDNPMFEEIFDNQRKRKNIGEDLYHSLPYLQAKKGAR